MAGKRKLDRSRPFGTIYGSGPASYEQFGILFDGAGDELPGFEEVEIPEEKVLVCTDDAGLRAQIETLMAESSALRAQTETALTEKDDALAQVEELQGKLDTANIEIARLNAQIDELTKLTDTKAENPPEQPVPTGKAKKGEQPSLIDDQLAAQSGVVS